MTPYINIRYKQLDNDVQSKYCTRWQELPVQIELYNHNMSMIVDAVSRSLTEQAWFGTVGMKSLSKTIRTSLTLNLRTTQFSLKLLSPPRKCLVHLSLKQSVCNPQDMQKKDWDWHLWRWQSNRELLAQFKMKNLVLQCLQGAHWQSQFLGYPRIPSQLARTQEIHGKPMRSQESQLCGLQNGQP